MSDPERGEGFVDVPTDLQVALAEHASAMSAWRELTPDQRRAHIAGLESAATGQARVRCLDTLIHDLAVTAPQESRK